MLSPDEGEKSDRMGFIRKVYGILALQLSITAMSIGAVQLNPSMHAAMQEHGMMAGFLFIVSVVIELALICNRDLARRVPTNYGLLAIFTLCQAFYFSFVTTFYD